MAISRFSLGISALLALEYLMLFAPKVGGRARRKARMAKKGKDDSAAPSVQAEAPSFEENLKRLEQIVSELEQGNQPLDKSLMLYEEGIKAYRTCHEILKRAEGKVLKLVETLEGDLKEEPFEVPREQGE